MLIKCSECEKEISDKASSCPHCGCPLDIAKQNNFAQETTPVNTQLDVETKIKNETHYKICPHCECRVLATAIKCPRCQTALDKVNAILKSQDNIEINQKNLQEITDAKTTTTPATQNSFGALGVLVFFIIVALILWFTFKPQQNDNYDNDYSTHNQISNSTTYNKSDTTDTNTVNLYFGGDRIVCATSKDNYDTFSKYSVNSNIEAINDMIDIGELFFVPSDTKALILDKGFSVAKVKIKEGSHDGETCWVAYECL